MDELNNLVKELRELSHANGGIKEFALAADRIEELEQEVECEEKRFCDLSDMYGEQSKENDRLRKRIEELEGEGSQTQELCIGRPKVICICGSTRFKDEINKVGEEQTLLGHIVLSVNVFSHADKIDLSADQLSSLKKVHLQKIEMCDEVLFVCPNNYIGDGGIEEIT